MRRLMLLALPALAAASLAHAQPADPHAHHRAAPAAPQPTPAADPHAHHRAPAAAAAPAPQADPAQAEADLLAAATTPVRPPPPSVAATLADAVWDPAAMARSRAILTAEHGGMNYWNVVLDRLEVRPAKGADGYAWEGWARYGGDIHRAVLKTEGEGRHGVEAAEVQALYSRAIGPYFDLQAGVRQDFQPKPRRTYATVGVSGLAPYWFEVEAAAFLSNKGELMGRLEADYDLRLTNRLILQPAVEATFAAQDSPSIGLGSGLSSAELGLRLRYDIRREFAPYVGVHHERRFGKTADYAGEASETRAVVGLRLAY